MDSAHQAMLRCVKVATEHTALRREAAAANRFVCLVELVSLVKQLESARVAPQVSTRILKEVSSARNALRDSRKTREERISAIHAAQARLPTKHHFSSATIVQKDTT